MVILCEGSTLKSKFSNSLTLFFCQAAGIMASQNKPCIAYGSEAGEMDRIVEKVVRRTCRKTFFIARSMDSLEKIISLGLKGELGTDTAWTFDSSEHSDTACSILLEKGWDGKKKLVGIAVINPFWWPVKPSIVKLLKAYFTGDWNLQYKKYFFFSWSKERELQYERYLTAIHHAVIRFSWDNEFFPILIGMENLDVRACNRLNEMFRTKAAIITAGEYNGFHIKEILNKLSILITSRYHARVLSFDTKVPAIAISMDERLDNIYREIGHFDDYCLKADDPDLEDRLYAALQGIEERRESIAEELTKAGEDYIVRFNRMGEQLVGYLRTMLAEME